MLFTTRTSGNTIDQYKRYHLMITAPESLTNPTMDRSKIVFFALVSVLVIACGESRKEKVLAILNLFMTAVNLTEVF